MQISFSEVVAKNVARFALVVLVAGAFIASSETAEASVAYRDCVLADGPVGYWRLGEANGSTVAADQTGSHDGTYVMDPLLGVSGGIAGDPNTAMFTLFNETRFVHVPHSPSLTPASNRITVEAWVLSDCPYVFRCPVMKAPSDFWLSAGGYGFYTSDGLLWFYNGEHVYVPNPGGCVDPSTTGAWPFPLGQYNHIVGTYDGATLKLYINGVLQGSKAASIPALPNTGALSIGTGSTPDTLHAPNFLYSWFGNTDEVAVYDYALSADQIQHHYDVGRAQFPVPPSVTCPDNVEVAGNAQNEAGDSGALVSYPNATATGECGRTFTATCSPPSGSFFVIGTTVVTCSATDEAGQTGSCAFTVSVTDTVPPQIHCPGDIALCVNAASTVVTWADPTATDNVDASVAVACTPASGSSFAANSINSVTCTATDDAGNEASCAFQVEVKGDLIPGPAMTCPASFSVSAADGQCAAVVNYPSLAATDDCNGGSVAVTCNPASGATLAVGEHNVTCTATDSIGQTSSCAFVVTVEDNQPPTISGCPGNIATATSSDGAGNCSAVVTYHPTAVDNCDGARTVNCVPPSGTAFGPGITAVHCSAQDSKLNTANCSFTVTVADDEAPTLACQNQVVVAPACGVGAPYSQPAASDNCAVTLSCTEGANPAAATLGVGIHPIQCTATDAGGNAQSCSFTVTVLEPVNVTFLPPLAGQPVANKIKHGQTLPHKVEVRDCAGSVVTSGITVTLAVIGTDSNPLTSDENVVEDATGIGTDGSLANDGLMVLVNSHWQFNEKTSDRANNNTCADGCSGYGAHYRSTATVKDSATGAVLGSATVVTETRP